MKSITGIPQRIIEAIVKKRNDSFDNGDNIVYRTIKPVISIGNLTFGGSGKTPLAIALALELMQNGIKPGIIGRGYKRTKTDTSIVCDGTNIIDDWNSAGDEMYLIAKKLNIPVVVHKHKYEAAKIIEQLNPDVIIVDDGFQHRKLARDIDLVIIDSKTIARPALPPKGALREPLDSLRRADLLLANEDLDIPETITRYVEAKPIRFRIAIDKIYNLYTNQTIDLLTKPLIAFCGIANPSRFEFTLQEEGMNIRYFHKFKDHYNYGLTDMEMLLQIALQHNINTLITTEKDAIKLARFADFFRDNDITLLVLPISLEITNGKNVLLSMIENILKERQ